MSLDMVESPRERHARRERAQGRDGLNRLAERARAPGLAPLHLRQSHSSM